MTWASSKTNPSKKADFSDLVKVAETIFPNISLKYSYSERKEMRSRYVNTPFLDKLRLAFGKNKQI